MYWYDTSHRDNLVLNRRRFVFLTNPAFLQREEEKKILKLTNAEAVVAKNLKRQADALEKINNPQPKQQRKRNHPNLVLKIKIPPKV